MKGLSFCGSGEGDAGGGGGLIEDICRRFVGAGQAKGICHTTKYICKPAPTWRENAGESNEIFWKGTHYERMQEFIAGILQESSTGAG